MSTRTAVVVGNPRPQSRTLAAATRLARELSGTEPDLVTDLAILGPRLLDWTDSGVTQLVGDIGDTDLVVVASPTYKGTYTGLLKLFLDRFASRDGLRGVAVPLMIGGSEEHALAPEMTLRPILTELGALVPAGGLFVVEGRLDDPEAYRGWLTRARPAIASLLSATTGARA